MAPSKTQIPFVDRHPEDHDEFDFSFRRMARYPLQVLVVWKKEPLFAVTLTSSESIRKSYHAGHDSRKAPPEKIFNEVALSRDVVERILYRIDIMTGKRVGLKQQLFSMIYCKREKDYYARKLSRRFKEFLEEQKLIS